MLDTVEITLPIFLLKIALLFGYSKEFPLKLVNVGNTSGSFKTLVLNKIVFKSSFLLNGVEIRVSFP